MNPLLIATSNWIRHSDKPRYPGGTCGNTTLNNTLYHEACDKVSCARCIHYIAPTQVNIVNVINRVLK